MLRSRWVLPALFTLFATLPVSAANVCVNNGTLNSYIALGSGGCTIGGLTVKDFSFSVTSSGGGDTPLNDTQITVALLFPAGGFGVQFNSTGFSVTGPQFVNYDIGFTWDPTGDMRSASDILDPGTADILTDLCVGDTLPACTFGTTHTLHVSQGGGPSVLTDSFDFPSTTGLVDVLNHIDLNNSGSFNGIADLVFIPEPGAARLAVAGLLMLAAQRRGASIGFHGLRMIARALTGQR
jgi:hypothetical protein